WIFRFSRPRERAARHAEKRPSNVTTKSLGPFPAVTIEMAKNRAEHARLILQRDKINPFEVDWNDGATTTYGEVAREWINSSAGSWKTKKQLHDTEHLLLVYGEPLLNVPIFKIRAKDIPVALKARCKDTPKQVRRALTKIENVFDYAI